MAALPEAPTEELQRLALEVLEAAALAGDIGDDPPTFRYHGNRETEDEERAGSGCVAIRFAGDGIAEDSDGGDINETTRSLELDLIYDFNTPIETADPLRIGLASRVLIACLKALRDEDSALRPKMWWLIMRSMEPDEDNAMDQSRLVQKISVIYRTHSVDPSILLS